MTPESLPGLDKVLSFASQRDGVLRARLAAHLDAPSWDGLRTAALGGFTCLSPEDGRELIETACRDLARRGMEAVIGPMDGNTWFPYRVAIETDGSPAFALEPPYEPSVRGAFEEAGFRVLATYASASAPVTPGEMPAVEGVTVAPWDGADADGLMADLFAMSSESFAGNPFYAAIGREDFDGLYRPYLRVADRRLILFARDVEGGLLGYVFGYPDPARPGAAILKTYASRRRGVGRFLVESFVRAAAGAGLTEVVHALMHEGNESLERSGRHGGRVFRRYALYGRRLDQS